MCRPKLYAWSNWKFRFQVFLSFWQWWAGRCFVPINISMQWDEHGKHLYYSDVSTNYLRNIPCPKFEEAREVRIILHNDRGHTLLSSMPVVSHIPGFNPQDNVVNVQSESSSISVWNQWRQKHNEKIMLNTGDDGCLQHFFWWTVSGLSPPEDGWFLFCICSVSFEGYDVLEMQKHANYLR